MKGRLVKVKGQRVLLGACCNLPHAKERGGKLIFRSPHEKRNAHPIELTPAELRELADELESEPSKVLRVYKSSTLTDCHR